MRSNVNNQLLTAYRARNEEPNRKCANELSTRPVDVASMCDYQRPNENEEKDQCNTPSSASNMAIENFSYELDDPATQSPLQSGTRSSLSS